MVFFKAWKISTFGLKPLFSIEVLNVVELQNFLILIELIENSLLTALESISIRKPQNKAR